MQLTVLKRFFHLSNIFCLEKLQFDSNLLQIMYCIFSFILVLHKFHIKRVIFWDKKKASLSMVSKEVIFILSSEIGSDIVM